MQTSISKMTHLLFLFISNLYCSQLPISPFRSLSFLTPMGGCCCKKAGKQGIELEASFFHHVVDEAEMINEDGPGAGTGGARVRYKGSSSLVSMFSQRGWKGVNQDAMTVWEDFGNESGRIFAGVFDGHGPYGHRVASYIRDNLPSKLASGLSKLSLEEDGENGKKESGLETYDALSTWITTHLNVFDELDKELKCHANIDCICSGTTAVTIVKENEHLMIANLGDSRAILCSRDDNNLLVPVQLTVDQKPNLPSKFTLHPSMFFISSELVFVTGEIKRITSWRGRVFALDEEPDVYRIWLPDEDSPGLAMARAFGDYCLKDYGLISTPEVTYRKLTEKDEFVVLATDGVWDVLSNEEVTKIVYSATKRCDAAKNVVKQAIKSWRSKFPTSRVDDCAVVCIYLKPPLFSHSTKSSFRIPGRMTSLSSESSFGESIKTTKSEDHPTEDEKWSALEGVCRSNSITRIPRFDGLVTALSWRKKYFKILEVNM